MYACQAIAGTILLGDKADMLVLVYPALHGFSQGLKITMYNPITTEHNSTISLQGGDKFVTLHACQHNLV